MKLDVRYYVLFAFVLFLSACGPTVLFEDKIEVEKAWTYNHSIDFAYEVLDTTQSYQMILEVEYDKSFKYQNLYTKMVTDFPGGESVEDIISLDIRKKTGESQGNCNSESCTVPFLIQDGVLFKKTGRYGLSIFQHSRKDSLMGINSLVFKIVEKE